MAKAFGRKPATEAKPASAGEVEDRIEERRLEAERIRLALATAGFDGPHDTTSNIAMIGPPLGSPKPIRYAICVGTTDIMGCGAMIRLDDPANAVDGVVKDPPIERSIFLHSRYHEALINLSVTVDGKQDRVAVKEPKPKKGKKS